MSRRGLAALVLAAWAGAMGWLLVRQMGARGPTDLAVATLRLPPGSSFYAVRDGERLVGIAGHTVDTRPDAIRVTERLDLTLPGRDSAYRVIGTVDGTYDRGLRLLQYRRTVSGTLGQYVLAGTVEEGDVLSVRLLRQGDSARTLRAPLRPGAVLPGALPLRAVFDGPLTPGREAALSVLDPETLESDSVTVMVMGDSTFILPDSAAYDSVRAVWEPARWDTVPAWRLVWREETGRGREAWVDRTGLVVRSTTPGGLTLERTAFELVNSAYRAAAPTAAGPTDPVPESILQGRVAPGRSAVRMTVLLEGAPDSTDLSLVGPGQERRGDTVRVRLLPPPGRLSMLRDTVADRYRSPEALFPSDDARIQAQARRIVGRRSPAATAEVLAGWVRAEIAPATDGGPPPPDAIRTLETRRGDAADMAALYIALARASNLAVRPVAGLLHAGGRFHYHTWAEVRLGAEWVPVDPVLGQFPADAAHLRLRTNALGRPLDLASRLGRLRPRLLSREPAP